MLRGLGESQRALLEALKRRGRATIPVLAGELGLSVETVRGHLRALTAHGLVERTGTRRSGPGRPEVVYGLTGEAERLFPGREAELLRGLAAYLRETGNEALLNGFVDRYVGARRAEALARVAGLEGRARLREASRILTELGFMAVVEEGAEAPCLRLCHCPLRGLVDATAAPCRAELGFVRELVGEPLVRESHIASGDPACRYRLGAA